MKGFLLFDADDRVLSISDEVLGLLGYSADKGGVRGWDSLVVEESRHFKPEGDEAVERRAFLKCDSGEIVEAVFRSQRVAGRDGLFVAQIAVGEAPEGDVESASDADSLSFLTTVSHELRIALNGVVGFANLLGSSGLTPAQLTIVEKLQSCNYLLKGLVNDILEYSRVASSKVDLSSENVHLLGLVEEIAGLFKERARKKGLELRVESDASAAIEVRLPKLRVAQVLSNLISNAIKFTESGWVRVFVSVEDAQICIDIEDTGRGIDEDEVAFLFRPFAQSHSHSSPHEGSGLGLSISKSLMERMGGSLRFDRPSRVGSVFRIRLPLKKGLQEDPREQEMADEGRREEDASIHAEKTSSRQPKRILIVEDNRLNADIISHFLQDYGAAFEVVDNGQSAVNAYEDGKYDLILMDVMLPEMNGYEATEEILAKSDRESPVPIVGVTAKVFRRDQMRCLEAGMVEVVHKPVDFKLLREVLDRHLYNKRSTRSSSPSSASELPRQARGSSRVGAIDRRTLESYIDRMKTETSSAQTVVETALEIVDAEVERLIDAIEKGDRREMELRSHSLKGALALLGARNVWELAKGLEAMAADENRSINAMHWKNLISGSYAEFKAAIDEFLGSSSTIS